jgi:carboxypeptidase C (cathepsin A)
MRHNQLLTTALFSAALIASPVLTLAQDDEPTTKSSTADKATDKTDDKAAEKAPPAEVTTQGGVDVAGQHIAYTAIAGTLTVGSTDVQDAQLGLDGKP